MKNIGVVEWDQELDRDHGPGKEIDVDPGVENIFGVTEKETEVDHGETNLRLLVLGDMIAGTFIYFYHNI